MGYAVAATGSWQLTIGAVGVGGLLALGFLRPALFLGLFLLIRPLAEHYSSSTIGIPSANLGGGLAAMLVVFAATLPLSTSAVVASAPMVAFGLVVLISAAGALVAMLDFGGTVGTEPVSEVVRLVSLLAIYLLAANILTSPERIRRLFVLVALSGLVPAIWGVLELLGGVEASATLDVARISGPFSGPNQFGMYLAASALVLIGLPSSWLPRGIRIAALIPVLVALVATYSRVGWVLFLAGLLLLEWRTNKRIVLGVAVLTAAVVALVPTVQERILPANDPISSERETYESFTWRVENWADLMAKAAEKPLIGHGTDTTVYVNPRRPVDTRRVDNGGFKAHNSLVRFAVEGGIVLLAAWALFLFCVLSTVRRLARSRWQFQELGRLVGILWVVVVLAALGSDDPFASTALMFPMFAMTAALDGAALKRAARRAGRPTVNHTGERSNG